MRKWYYRTLFALACAGVVGCAEQVDTAKQAQYLAELRAGQAVLGCREPCLAAWRSAQPQAAQLDAGARWQDLALLVMRIGYQDDLSLYYLGRAAEGIRYQGAAAAYFRQSARVSGTPASCQKLSGLCGGVTLPRAAAARRPSARDRCATCRCTPDSFAMAADAEMATASASGGRESRRSA